jgi:hypothetical protein
MQLEITCEQVQRESWLVCKQTSEYQLAPASSICRGILTYPPVALNMLPIWEDVATSPRPQGLVQLRRPE